MAIHVVHRDLLANFLQVDDSTPVKLDRCGLMAGFTFQAALQPLPLVEEIGGGSLLREEDGLSSQTLCLRATSLRGAQFSGVAGDQGGNSGIVQAVGKSIASLKCAFGGSLSFGAFDTGMRRVLERQAPNCD